MEVRDIIIIGGGPAGLTGAIYAARSLRKAAVIEKGIPGGQIAMTDIIENYPGFPDGISGMELMQRFEEQAKRFGAEFINLFEVKTLETKEDLKIIKGADGRSFASKVVIIATGQDPKPLNVPGEDRLVGKGVSYCATCDGAFFKNMEVAVVGGGNSAIQEAIFLTRFASRVVVIHRRDQLRADKILQKKAFENEKISFLWDSVVVEVLGNDKVTGLKVRNVKTDDVKEVNVDGVFVFIGYTPNTSFLKGIVELDKNGYVITDENLQTNVPGIFAAGDVRANTLKQVAVAVGEGALAATNAERYLENI